MVKAGYKQTEVGEIPEDWELNTIGQHFDFKNGLNKAKEFFGHGTPIINYMDVFNNPGVTNSDIAGKVAVTRDEINSYSARKGDVFFTRTSETVDEIGLSTVLTEEVKDAVFSGFVLRARDKGSDFDLHFKKYCFRSEPARKQIKATSSYTTRALTNGKLLSQVLIAYPKEPDEQKAIAGALSDVDALIASLEKLIEKKRDIKTATMQQLLTGKRRLPGFEAQWCYTEIGSHIDLLTGFPFPSSGYASSGVRLLRGSNIKRGQLDWSDELIKFWPKVDGDIAKYALHEGDIVVAMDGSLVGRSFGQISKSDLPALLLQRVARIRSKGIDQGLLKEWICSPFFTEHCDNVKTVTAVPHISPDDILNFRIHVSEDLDEQKAIGAFLADASNELRILESRLAKTKALKQGMMQELLTGRTRLV